MKIITKNATNKAPILIGFFISFLGSLPLGYINIVGLKMLLEQGSLALLLFVSGVVFIELFVLFAVSKLAKWLVKQKGLLLFIDLFTILFFLGIAYYFYSDVEDKAQFSLSQWHLVKYPLLLGLLLNSLNFIQWPYWSGMYLYLFRTKKLKETKMANTTFIFGALLGTMVGMLTFVYASKFILEGVKVGWNQYLNIILAFIFLILALIQLGTFSFKQYRLIKN